MTEQAPPDYYFQNIIFNPKYYDNEVNNNITKYEADNKYIKYNTTNLQLTKTEAGLTTTINDLRLTSIGRLNNLFNLPTNTTSASPNSYLVLTDNVSKNTTWYPPITRYTDYDTTTKKLSHINPIGTSVEITELVLSSINPSSINAGSGLIQTTGEIKSRLLTIQNATPTTTATITTAGAITGTSLSAGTGAINGGTITGTSLSAGTGLISTTGSLQARGLTIKNTSDVNVATISNLGALVCTTIQNNGNTLNCGDITCGVINTALAINSTGTTFSTGINAKKIYCTGSILVEFLDVLGSGNNGIRTDNGHIYSTGTGNISTAFGNIYTTNGSISCLNGSMTCSSLSAGTGLIETTGSLKSRGLTIQNTTPSDVATISNTGAIIGTSLSAGSGLIETTGSLKSRGLTIQNTTPSDVATISNTGAIIGTSLSAGTGLISTTGSLQSRGLSIKNTSNVDVATISNTGVMTGTTLTLNGVSGLSCYNLDIRNSSDNSFRGSINGLFGLFSFRGAIECTEYTIKDFTTSTINATINSLGEIDCKALTCTSVGSSTAEKFVLPSNSSTAPLNSVLTLSNTTTKATTWITIPIQISVYVSYNFLTGVFINNTNGIQTNITSITVDDIGKSGQTFILPTNTSTAPLNSVLTLTNTTTKATTWTTIANITNYVNYSNPNLISNVSGTPTTITDLTITNIKSNSYDSSVADTGVITIGGGTARTGDINIGTAKNTSSAQLIRIGSNDSNATGQEIRFSRPIQPPAIIQLSDRDMGYTLSNLTATTTAYASGTVSLSIPSTNLYSNGNYMFRSSLKISSNNTAKALTSIKFGLNRSNAPIGYIENCHTDMLINTGTAVIFVNKIYQLSSFFRTVGGASYTFDYVITFTGTGTLNVVSSIDIIRMS